MNSYEIKMVDCINISGANQRFEIVVGTNGVRKYDVAPGQVVQVEDGYTRPIAMVPGRTPRPSILSQLAPGMRRLDEVDEHTLAALRAQYAPKPADPPKRGPGRLPAAQE